MGLRFPLANLGFIKRYFCTTVNTDLQLKPHAKQSGITGRPFDSDSLVVSWLFIDAKGDYLRIDAHPDESPASMPEARLLCRWQRKLRPVAHSDAEARRQALLSAEELFFALHENSGVELPSAPDSQPATPSVGDTEARRTLFKYMLALLLERKRVLRLLPGSTSAQSQYLHVKSKRTFSVDTVPLGPETLIRLAPQIEQLFS